MSIPLNPLDDKSSVVCRCVLVAFPDTISAENAEIDLDEDVFLGQEKYGGVVLASDFAPTSTQIIQFSIDYTWRSVEVLSTLTAGEMMVVDRNATSFLNVLKTEVVDRFSISLENITFVLKTFFIVGDDSGGGTNIIHTNSFIFSVPDIRHLANNKTNSYMLTMLALYNAKTQLPNYSSLYNFTLTHAEGNLNKEIPIPDPVLEGIQNRAEEDSAKSESRSVRLNKSRPMITLGDAFNALEKDLNESVDIHDMQLQKWQEVIRDDFSTKLGIPAIQTKDIPIKYTVTLDPEYVEYKIDNRNLPFEQPEQTQTQIGIRSIPCKAGESLYSVIDKIFAYSKKIGEDAIDGFRPKVVCTWRKIGENVHLDIVVKKVAISVNQKGSKDTGPGDGGVNPLEFFYRTNSSNPAEQNTDTNHMIGRVSRNDKIEITENSASTGDGRVSYGGDRENITVERNPDKPFFQNGFSGHRSFLATHKVMGVEYPKELAKYLSSGYTNQYLQDGGITIQINGNPELFSDLMRHPSDVANGQAGSSVNLYKFPEVFPMYAKVRIYYNLNENLGRDSGIDPEFELRDTEFYHEDTFMHIHKVTSTMNSGKFTQVLHLLRTDDLI